ncbi:MAG: hypothetical protein GY929_10860 [Actinomycetia bacterium]|nr:hypothetical protein [Actinomycetes bacterium]
MNTYGWGMGATADTPPEPLDRLTDAARQSLDITVGLGVLAFQDLQVRRRQIEEQLTESGDLERIRAVARWLAGWSDR